MSGDKPTFRERHAEIRDRIHAAAIASDRNPADIQLVGACKRQPDEVIRAALDDGLDVFGENRVQEAQSRWQTFSNDRPRIELHLIGPLQSNKVADAVSLFDVIQTVDRRKIAVAIKTEMDKTQRQLRLFVQVNTGEELQKAGILPGDLDDFLSRIRNEVGLKIDGLMCIPPANEPAALHFGFLSELADRNQIEHRSMGMSADYETGIKFGATHVRVGSALFGERAR